MSEPNPIGELNPEATRQALAWGLESSHDPARAAADWLAREIDPSCTSAVDLLTHPAVSLESLRQAKDAFKTMRLLGETAADRQVGARLYLGAMTAALVRHGVRISRQSDAAIRRNLRHMVDDELVPPALREMARTALEQVLGGTPDGDSDAG